VNCQEDKKNLKFRSCLAGKPNSVKEEFKEKKSMNTVLFEKLCKTVGADRILMFTAKKCVRDAVLEAYS
jgi:hypothetical protein